VIALISLLLTLFTLVLLLRAILSWFPQQPGAMASVNRFAYTVTEPVVGPVRRILPPMGGFDLSILVVFIGIYVLRMVIGI
jgi:YggT family protein